MSQLEERTTGATHEVFNQSVPLEGYNVFAADRVLVEALEREGAEWASSRARELGEVCGRPDVLRKGALADEWERRFLSLAYDGRLRPAPDKPGALCGMAMTEKQGGSDVRANTTTATPIDGGGPGGEYEITGHKWFCSAPMCDAFLVLAQADGGLSCFLLPRFAPDGERNRFHIQRLKDKLGNRSNASSEVE